MPGVAALGAGLDLPANPMKLRAADAKSDSKLKRAYDVLDRAVADHAFPGGVLAVGYQGELMVHAFGRQTYDATSPAVNVDTIYDAASLTKPWSPRRSWPCRLKRAALASICPWRATFPNGMPGRIPSGAKPSRSAIC